MKTTVIGDIHGRTIWQEIVTRESDSDLFVFMGDYFDSYEQEITSEMELVNFKNIVEYKENNPDKVILLMGNHDYHYFPNITASYSRYDWRFQTNFRKALANAYDKGLLKVCHVQDDILFVHAGVTKTWCKDHDIDPENIEEEMHNLWEESKNSFGFIYGERLSPYGDDICQSPFWVRPMSLSQDRIEEYIQIVGHTQVKKIDTSLEGMILVDALGEARQYLTITDKRFEVKDVD